MQDLIRFANEAYQMTNLANEHHHFRDDHLTTVQYTCGWRTESPVQSINTMREFLNHQKRTVNHQKH